MNFALLKIVQRTLESEADRDTKIVVLKYQSDKKTFVASMKEDRSLAHYLMTPSPPQEKSQSTK